MLHLMAPSLIDVRVDPEIEHQIVHEKTLTIAVQTALTRKTLVSDELSRSSIAAYFLTETNSLSLRTLISIPLMVQNELQGVLEDLVRATARQSLSWSAPDPASLPSWAHPGRALVGRSEDDEKEEEREHDFGDEPRQHCVFCIPGRREPFDPGGCGRPH